MNETLKSLIPAIACYVKDEGGYLSKTKLLKLLYLVDVEFYRLHRHTFTGFQWKFYHLGPWTNEFDPMLEELVRSGLLFPRPNSNPEFDTKSYESSEDLDIDSIFTDYRDTRMIKNVLSTWAERSTSEILDYVYFHTEPMEHGMRNTPLDFTLIPEQPPARYSKSVSHTPPREAARLRSEYCQKRAELRARPPKAFSFTPPRYDDEFFQAMAKLEQPPP